MCLVGLTFYWSIVALFRWTSTSWLNLLLESMFYLTPFWPEVEESYLALFLKIRNFRWESTPSSWSSSKYNSFTQNATPRNAPPCYVTTPKTAAKETREFVAYEIPTTRALFRQYSSRHIYFLVDNLFYAISKSVPALEQRPLCREGSAFTTGPLLPLPMVSPDGVTGEGELGYREGLTEALHVAFCCFSFVEVITRG